MDYKIVKEPSPVYLEEAVDRLIEYGYVPQGGVVVSPSDGTWAQAMTRTEAQAAAARERREE